MTPDGIVEAGCWGDELGSVVILAIACIDERDVLAARGYTEFSGCSDSECGDGDEDLTLFYFRSFEDLVFQNAQLNLESPGLAPNQ